MAKKTLKKTEFTTGFTTGFSTAFSTAFILCAGVMLGSSPVYGFTLSEASKPAELPSASYTKDVYVDSRGCIYFRAGRQGAAVWLPRITRKRTVLCDGVPTLDNLKVQITPKAQNPARSSGVSQSAGPAIGSHVRPVARPTVPTPANSATAFKDVDAEDENYTRIVRVNCAGRQEQFEARLKNGLRLPIQCQPRNQESYAYTVSHANGERSRVIVRGLDHKMTGSQTTGSQTTGSKTTGPKTLGTETPNLQAPQTASLNADAGHGIGKPRFIQVGAFADPSNAEAVIKRLKALGMGTRSQSSNYNGKPIQTIFAGPFSPSEQLGQVLNNIQNAGFSDAFVVK